MRKILLALLIIMMSFTLGISPTLAQSSDETGTPTGTSDTPQENTDVNAGENEVTAPAPTETSTDTGTPANTTETGDTGDVPAEELGVSEPSSFLWFHNFVLNVRIALTPSPIKKSELELKKAATHLLLARQAVQKNPNDPELQAKLDELNNRYQAVIEKINARIETYKTNNPDAPELKNFLDKYVDQQLKHQEVLSSLENRVPADVAEKIREKRLTHLERFGNVMSKLQTDSELKARLEKSIDNRENRVERRVNRVEILNELKDKVPAEMKQNIEQIKQERTEIFRELKNERQDIRENRQEIEPGDATSNKDVIQENRDEKQDVRDERQDFRQDIKNR